jgi:hypothetical protein
MRIAPCEHRQLFAEGARQKLTLTLPFAGSRMCPWRHGAIMH